MPLTRYVFHVSESIVSVSLLTLTTSSSGWYKWNSKYCNRDYDIVIISTDLVTNVSNGRDVFHILLMSSLLSWLAQLYVLFGGPCTCFLSMSLSTPEMRKSSLVSLQWHRNTSYTLFFFPRPSPYEHMKCIETHIIFTILARFLLSCSPATVFCFCKTLRALQRTWALLVSAQMIESFTSFPGELISLMKGPRCLQ